MARKGYKLTRDAAKTVFDTVVRVGKLPGDERGLPISKRRHPPGRNIQPLRITSTTTTAGLYPAVLLRWNRNASPPRVDRAVVWATTMSGDSLLMTNDALTVGHYHGICIVNHTDGRPVFDVVPSGSESDEEESDNCFKGAKVYLTHSWTAGDPPVEWNQTAEGAYDAGGYFDPAQPDRLTVPESGFYEIEAFGYWMAFDQEVHDFYLKILHNGVTGVALEEYQLPVTAFPDAVWTMQPRTKMFAAAGDYFTVEPATDPFGQQTLLVGTPPLGTWFSIERLGDACDLQFGGAYSGSGTTIGSDCEVCAGLTPVVWTIDGTGLFGGTCSPFNRLMEFVQDGLNQGPCFYYFDDGAGNTGNMYVGGFIPSQRHISVFLFNGSTLVSAFRLMPFNRDCCSPQVLSNYDPPGEVPCSTSPATITAVPSC